jgi:catechol 2,3-dioxygenase-like lactoylglutathione lyase family enzyme
MREHGPGVRPHHREVFCVIIALMYLLAESVANKLGGLAPGFPHCSTCCWFRGALKLAQSKSIIHSMNQSIGQVAIVVRDYNEALNFYVRILGFGLIEDTPIVAQDKRWVVVAPSGSNSTRLLLARAVGEEQVSSIGNQTGGRVFLFLYTDDFWRDFNSYKARGSRLHSRTERGTLRYRRSLQGPLWQSVGSAATPSVEALASVSARLGIGGWFSI